MPRTSTPALSVPLGSLTQHGARGEASCAACGSERVTSLSMTLTDGTPVDFVSCHRCEHKTWRDASGLERSELAVDSVLSRARKQLLKGQ
jgi:hypothetical protein